MKETEWNILYSMLSDEDKRRVDLDLIILDNCYIEKITKSKGEMIGAKYVDAMKVMRRENLL